MASEDESEYCTIFVNTQTDVPIRTTLTKLGWKQGPTAIQVENSTAVGIATKDFRQNKSQAILCDAPIWEPRVKTFSAIRGERRC